MSAGVSFYGNMAEAAAATPTKHRFFCHCCRRETHPQLPEFVCPRCKSDFIEEVEHNSRLLENSTPETSQDSNSFFSELWQLLFMERSALLTHPPPSSESVQDDGETLLGAQSRLPLVAPGNAEVRELHFPSQPEERRSPRPEQRPQVDGMMQHLLADLFTSNGNPSTTPAALSSMLQLYSNPADYAWGQGGLDTVITEASSVTCLCTCCQLPVPASTATFMEDCRLECTICREEYSSGECVRKLPCLHYFHSECIVPWLELHDTCPVCRKSLDGVDNSLLLHASQSPEAHAIRTEQQGRQAI
ncbi:E3 ubiquitin-protein ligase RNF115-like isoform X2 [Festucalex cinctus]